MPGQGYPLDHKLLLLGITTRCWLQHISTHEPTHTVVLAYTYCRISPRVLTHKSIRTECCFNASQQCVSTLFPPIAFVIRAKSARIF